MALTKYQKYVKQQIKKGKTMKQIGKSWQSLKKKPGSRSTTSKNKGGSKVGDKPRRRTLAVQVNEAKRAAKSAIIATAEIGALVGPGFARGYAAHASGNHTPPYIVNEALKPYIGVSLLPGQPNDVMTVIGRLIEGWGPGVLVQGAKKVMRFFGG